MRGVGPRARGRTVAIVQARMGSTRLPGKVLRPLGGNTVLGQVLARLGAVPGLEAVCCATSTSPADDAVAAEAARAGATVHRGPEDDVLARYAGAAGAMEAEVVLRATGDCPALDPAVCGALLELRARARADYAANNMPPSWPHGLDCEAFTRDALDAAAAQAATPFEREHVSPWMRASPTIRRANLEAPAHLSPRLAVETRWTLDYAEDYAFFEALYARLPSGARGYGLAAVLEVLAAHPEIARLNRSRLGATRAAPFGPLAVSAPPGECAREARAR